MEGRNKNENASHNDKVLFRRVLLDCEKGVKNLYDKLPDKFPQSDNRFEGMTKNQLCGYLDVLKKSVSDLDDNLKGMIEAASQRIKSPSPTVTSQSIAKNKAKDAASSVLHKAGSLFSRKDSKKEKSHGQVRERSDLIEAFMFEATNRTYGIKFYDEMSQACKQGDFKKVEARIRQVVGSVLDENGKDKIVGLMANLRAAYPASSASAAAAATDTLAPESPRMKR